MSKKNRGRRARMSASPAAPVNPNRVGTGLQFTPKPCLPVPFTVKDLKR